MWRYIVNLLSYLPFVKDIKKGVYRFMVRGVRTGSFIPALFLISGLLFLGIHLTERQITYTIINNETPDLSGGAVLL
jgi:hypothetical protein